MRRKAIFGFLIFLALAVATAIAWPRISYHMLTGSFVPIHKVESLLHPVNVNGWTSNGLVLVDGRLLQLPGFRSLPDKSPALTEATKRGVEITGDGRVVGLMRIHHWCGNDPVREHIARVDISEVMMFLRVGETVAPVPEPDLTVHEASDRFSEYGWNVSQFFQFQGWQLAKKVASEQGD